MKLILLCLTLFAGGAVCNSIDDLVKNAFEYIRKQLKEHEPLKIPDIPRQYIKDNNPKSSDLVLDLNSIYVSKAADFTVNNIQNNLIDFWAKYDVSVPMIHLEGKYTISGSAVGHTVGGTGTFTAEVTGLKVRGKVQNELLDDKYLHVQSMTIDYDIENVKFSEEGLVVQGMTQDELTEIFNKQFLKFFNEKKDLVCAKLEKYATDTANELIKGKTLEEVISWLRHIIQ